MISEKIIKFYGVLLEIIPMLKSPAADRNLSRTFLFANAKLQFVHDKCITYYTIIIYNILVYTYGLYVLLRCVNDTAVQLNII